MTEENLDYFHEIFIQAVSQVEPAYIRTYYNEMDMVLQFVESESQRRNLEAFRIGDSIVKSGERIFCYELYHQLRLLMQEHPTRFGNTVLQGELRKHQIMPLIHRMGLQALSGDFTPDFLLHTPGNAEDHAFVIEVKTIRSLNYRQLAADISKIAEFIEYYRYQRGIFLSINTGADNLRQLVTNCWLLREIPNIREIASQIDIVGRADEHSPTISFKLSEIIT
jgi:hypothetical protein